MKLFSSITVSSIIVLALAFPVFAQATPEAGSKNECEVILTSANYYERLGVNRTATPEEIKKAYRELAQRFHPDKHQSADSETRKTYEAAFQKIGEAYEVLRDPQRRADYDEGRKPGRAAKSERKKWSYTDAGSMPPEIEAQWEQMKQFLSQPSAYASQRGQFLVNLINKTSFILFKKVRADLIDLADGAPAYHADMALRSTAIHVLTFLPHFAEFRQTIVRYASSPIAELRTIAIEGLAKGVEAFPEYRATLERLMYTPLAEVAVQALGSRINETPAAGEILLRHLAQNRSYEFWGLRKKVYTALAPAIPHNADVSRLFIQLATTDSELRTFALETLCNYAKTPEIVALLSRHIETADWFDSPDLYLRIVRAVPDLFLKSDIRARVVDAATRLRNTSEVKDYLDPSSPLGKRRLAQHESATRDGTLAFFILRDHSANDPAIQTFLLDAARWARSEQARIFAIQSLTRIADQPEVLAFLRENAATALFSSRNKAIRAAAIATLGMSANKPEPRSVLLWILAQPGLPEIRVLVLQALAPWVSEPTVRAAIESVAAEGVYREDQKVARQILNPKDN